METTDTVRIAGGVFDSDGNPADGDLVIKGQDVDGQAKIVVSTADAFPLALADVQLAIPLDVAALILNDAGYEVLPVEDLQRPS